MFKSKIRGGFVHMGITLLGSHEDNFLSMVFLSSELSTEDKTKASSKFGPFNASKTHIVFFR